MPPNDSDLPYLPDPPAEPGVDPEWIDGIPLVDPVQAIRCWRCSRVEIPTAGRCPACHARVADDTEGRSLTGVVVREPAAAVTSILVMYGLFLLTSVVWGWVLLANETKLTEQDAIAGMAVIEVIDTVLVLATLAMIGFVAMPRPPKGTRALCWVLAGPALFLLICGNVLYAAILHDLIRPRAFLPPEATALSAVNILLICVQPAIIEELFFRYLALGVLYRATGMATAVWVTAVMFAVAHLYNPLGVPYLFVAGVVFGYARVYGGLLLPIVMHFLHNLAVIAIEVPK